MEQTKDAAVVGLAKSLDPVAACFTPEVAQRIVVLRVDPEVHARIALLAEKCNEGTMTPEERAEYEVYIQAMDVVAVLQKQAKALLMHAPPHHPEWRRPPLPVCARMLGIVVNIVRSTNSIISSRFALSILLHANIAGVMRTAI